MDDKHEFINNIREQSWDNCSFRLLYISPVLCVRSRYTIQKLNITLGLVNMWILRCDIFIFISDLFLIFAKNRDGKFSWSDWVLISVECKCWSCRGHLLPLQPNKMAGVKCLDASLHVRLLWSLNSDYCCAISF